MCGISALASLWREGWDLAPLKDLDGGLGPASLFPGESGERLDSQSAGTDQAAQGPFRHFPMIGHRKGGDVAFLHQDHMAAALPHHLPAISDKNPNYVAPAKLRR